MRRARVGRVSNTSVVQTSAHACPNWLPILCRLSFALIMGSQFVLSCSPKSPPGFWEQNVQVSLETLKRYPTLFSVDRQRLGFPPLPTNGTVRILTVDRERWDRKYAPPSYDVSFQFYSGSSFYPYTSRFIALKRSNDGYSVVSEQMTFNGPKRYEVDDTMVNESISLVNETEQIAFVGTNITGTVIRYRGPDQRFGKGRWQFEVDGLTPSDIGPVLREWGYDYVVDCTPQGEPATGSRRTHFETNSSSSAVGSLY